MELKTNAKGLLSEWAKTCCKTGQNKINYKCHILKSQGNFRINKLKFQKEEKLFHVNKEFYLSFLWGIFWLWVARWESGLTSQKVVQRKEKLASFSHSAAQGWQTTHLRNCKCTTVFAPWTVVNEAPIQETGEPDQASGRQIELSRRLVDSDILLVLPSRKFP